MVLTPSADGLRHRSGHANENKDYIGGDLATVDQHSGGRMTKGCDNSPWVSYVDSNVRDSGRPKIAWFLFDYKTVQESPHSGKRYLSEKAQREIDCQNERGRVLFFTWHANSKGDGVFIYTGDKPLS